MSRKKLLYTQHKFSALNYISFLALTAFIVTCSFLLFLSFMDFSEEEIRKSAGWTFLNVLFLSLVFTIIDAVRRKITVERPMKKIIEATNKITSGDFSVRLKPMFGENSVNEFDIIARNLNKMAEELAGIETLRSDFISNVSHEIKTPLAAIQNYSTMLTDTSISEEERVQYANNILISSQRLSSLITNILKLNKLENQQIFPEKKRYNLSEQLCGCLLNFESVWERKNINIETDIDDDIYIFADEELLEIVWNNLFSNAMKFTDENGKVTASLKDKDGYIYVSICDTGCGISPETGKHIFDKFYQGDTSHSTQGNGLGLALVKRITNITGGEISVDSEVGNGSTFTVKLLKEVEQNA